MQVTVVCDDGFQSKIFISNNITGQDLFHEVCNLRRSIGYDQPQDPTPAFYTIGYSVLGRPTEYITSLVVLDHILPTAASTAAAVANSANKNTNKPTPVVFNIFGFATLKRNNVLLQLREFSSKLAVMSMSFSSAVDHFQRGQLNPSSLLPAGSTNASMSSSSQAMVPFTSSNDASNSLTIEDITNKINHFFTEIHQLFDHILATGDATLTSSQRSLLTKARGKFWLF